MYLVRVFSENEAVDFVRGLGLVGRLTPLWPLCVRVGSAQLPFKVQSS